MKKVIVFLFVLIVFSCTGVKNVYEDGKLDVQDDTVKYLLEKFNAKDGDKSIIYFTTGFGSDTVELINGKETLFKRAIKTMPSVGLATIMTVDNNEKVIINDLSNKSMVINLNKKKLKEYKFIYVSRDDETKKYLIEYSNRTRNFL